MILQSFEFTDDHVLQLLFESGGENFRSTRAPGADISDLPEELRADAAERWTAPVISAYAEVVSASPFPPLTPEEQAAADRLAQFPNLEPDRFWFAVRLGGYEQDLRSWVASLNDPESPNHDVLAWAVASAKLDFAKHFERDHPLVLAAAAALNISELELDQLWQVAAFG